MEELLTKLKKLANKRRIHENSDFVSADYGNLDDLYWAGTNSGEISLAREVLAVLEPSYKIEIEPED